MLTFAIVEELDHHFNPYTSYHVFTNDQYFFHTTDPDLILFLIFNHQLKEKIIERKAL